MTLRGLTVGADQTLRLNGARFRNIGLNYGGAVVPIYTQPSATACAYTSSADQDAAIAVAVSCKAKVLRVKVTPYWPAQWTYGVNGGKSVAAATSADREAHYQKIDAFLAKCQAAGIGVILNLFFRMFSPSDLVGERGRAWLTPGSATRNFATTITQEVVTRYLNHDAVYGWEFSNEVNHYNDASDATRGNYPGVNAAYGSLSSYSAAQDLFTGSELSTILSWWYGVVTAIDNQRIVLTGNGPNSYSQPGGSAGISSPMRAWHLEQVRDNPTNCGSIHWYGNVGYGSNNFRGLESVLTGVRHWQKANGRGFVLGEFGNQPWNITSLIGDGTGLTIACANTCPVETGDTVLISGTGSVFDGQTLTLSSVNGSRNSLNALCGISGSWSGSFKGLQFMTQARLTRICNEIINSGTDVALLWALDTDPATPLLENIGSVQNAFQRTVIAAANASLGW